MCVCACVKTSTGAYTEENELIVSKQANERKSVSVNGFFVKVCVWQFLLLIGLLALLFYKKKYSVAAHIFCFFKTILRR